MAALTTFAELTMSIRSIARLAAVVPVLVASLLAQAQTPADSPDARQAAAAQLIRSIDDLMGPESMARAMRGAMQAPMAQALAGNTRLTEAQKQRVVQVMGDEMTAITTELMQSVKSGLYNAMTTLYAERFSVAELLELQRFYASPVVRKATLMVAEDMPRLMQPMLASMQQMAPRMKERMDAATARLKAEGIDPSGR